MRISGPNRPETAKGGCFRPAAARAARILRTPPRLRFLLGSLAVLLTLLVVGVVQYHHGRAQRGYLKNYVLALYGIKSGFDRGSAIGHAYVTEWRRSEDLGIPPPKTDTVGLADLGTVQGEVDLLMEQLGDPPSQLRRAAACLGRLYAVYRRQNSLARSPQGSPSGYDQALKATQADFFRTLEELKSALPVTLRHEVRKSGTKYNLRFLD